MSDLGVIKYVDTLTYSSVRLVSARPRIIEVTGEDFSSASVVQVNGQPCRFEPIGVTRILVELPIEIESVLEIAILSASPTATKESTSVQIGIFDRPQKISGFSKLIQRVIKILLTTEGTNIIEPSEGGSLQALIGSNVRDAGTLTAEVSGRIESVEEYFLTDPNYGSLPDSEKLRSIEISELTWDKDSQTIRLDLQITAADGNVSITRVEV